MMMIKTLSFLLFLTFCLSSTQGLPDPVRDTDGSLIRSGRKYYILPAIHRIRGGFTPFSIRNDPCPLDVTQAYVDYENGLPLTFTPVNPKKGVIRESTDLNIKFSGQSVCNESNVWGLEEYNGQKFISTNGISGNPGRQTISNWFKIEKFDSDYKIVFCPTVCDSCKVVCGDIGIKVDDIGRGIVVVSDDYGPFMVKFQKA